jgi:hypothetical protein
VVWKRGAGTDAAKRQRRESGSMSTATVPSEKGFSSAMRLAACRARVPLDHLDRHPLKLRGASQ